MRGIDISHWQHTVDFKKVKDSGVEFVIAKISQSTGKDSMFNTYYAEGSNLVKFGGYIYNKVYSIESAKQEALNALKCIEGKRLPCGVWLDMEDSTMRTRLSKSTLTDIINTEATIIRSAGFNVGIYCNLDWYKNVLDSALLKQSYPFWIARYSRNDDGTVHDNLSVKDIADIWQFSSKGKVDGIIGNVDLDMLYTSFDTMFSKAAPIAGSFNYPTLRKGNKGEYVKLLQQLLNQNGAFLTVDASFGPNTYNAVISFQGEHDLVKDGIVGRKTWTELLK